MYLQFLKVGENEFGHKTEVELNKVDGKWQFGINYEEESDYL